jgi:hypothetical protein
MVRREYLYQSEGANREQAPTNEHLPIVLAWTLWCIANEMEKLGDKPDKEIRGCWQELHRVLTNVFRCVIDSYKAYLLADVSTLLAPPKILEDQQGLIENVLATRLLQSHLLVEVNTALRKLEKNSLSTQA